MSRTATPVSGEISVADFDPNVSLSSKPFWMTYGGYSGSLMLRRTRGPAIGDFSKLAHAKLFEWDPTGPCWRLIAYKDPSHPPCCDHCGLTTFDHPLAGWRHPTLDYGEVDYNAPQENMGKWRFVRRGSKLVQPLACEYMCRTCQENHG